jgi:lysozyme
MTLDDWIKGNEGLRLKLYTDTRGVPSIGYGRNLRDDGVSTIEANYLFDHDLANAIRGAAQSVGSPYWLQLDPVRKAALIDMCFELGEYGLAEFHKMLAHVRAGEWQAAADELLNSLYAQQVPTRAHRNAALLLTGEWPP